MLAVATSTLAKKCAEVKCEVVANAQDMQRSYFSVPSPNSFFNEIGCLSTVQNETVLR